MPVECSLKQQCGIIVASSCVGVEICFHLSLDGLERSSPYRLVNRGGCAVVDEEFRYILATHFHDTQRCLVCSPVPSVRSDLQNIPRGPRIDIRARVDELLDEVQPAGVGCLVQGRPADLVRCVDVCTAFQEKGSDIGVSLGGCDVQGRLTSWPPSGDIGPVGNEQTHLLDVAVGSRRPQPRVQLRLCLPRSHGL